jgi:hypothetical protein
MPFNVALVQVIWPGSGVPGPPRAGPKKTGVPGVVGCDNLTDATSNVGLGMDCATVSAHPKANKQALMVVGAITSIIIGELEVSCRLL